MAERPSGGSGGGFGRGIGIGEVEVSNDLLPRNVLINCFQVTKIGSYW